jgi:hypothetical protein
MLKRKTIRGSTRRLLTAVIVSNLTSVCFGATVIGQWSGNSSHWASSGNFSTLYTALTAAGPSGPGYNVTSGQAITQANLSQDNFFVVDSSSAAVSASEAATLANWVRAGGILLLFAAGNSQAAANSVLGSLGAGASGTALSVTPQAEGSNLASIFTGGGLWSADPSVKGPTNLMWAPLNWYDANIIGGGNSLAVNIGTTHNLSSAMRVDNFALGKVYVFGDRFDTNALTAGGANANLALFLNLFAQSNSVRQFSGTSEVPEPSTLLLTGLGITGALFWRRRQSLALR